jgi:hypothetical protein
MAAIPGAGYLFHAEGDDFFTQRTQSLPDGSQEAEIAEKGLTVRKPIPSQ